ncbi:hypothetical protein NMD1_00885 [Novosphingobium sp. MD-1]|nr:hypothetical protein NMD1_00885 [Novosphingobium sp. MD-1]
MAITSGEDRPVAIVPDALRDPGRGVREVADLACLLVPAIERIVKGTHGHGPIAQAPHPVIGRG